MRPGDERGFIHKKIFGGIKGAVGSVVSSITSGSLPTPASVVRGGIGGFFRGGGGTLRPPAPFQGPSPSLTLGTNMPTVRTPVAPGDFPATPAAAGAAFNASIPGFLPHPAGGGPGHRHGIFAHDNPLLRQVTGNGGTPFGENGGNGTVCEDPRLEPTGPGGRCEFPGSPASGVGELRPGLYGPAIEPFFIARNIRDCPDGMILGKDKLCYNKGTISNNKRLWPKGRAPLLTGGEMRAIAKAAQAGKKFQRTKSRLERLGFVKKPKSRGRVAKPKAVIQAPDGSRTVQVA